MSGPLPEWEELNAYLDGELAPEDKARVARAISRVPALAQRVAVLASLKAEMKTALAPMRQLDFKGFEDCWEGRFVRAAGRPRRRWTARMAASAAVAASMLLAIISLFALSAFEPEPRAVLFEAAIAKHGTLSQAPLGGLEGARRLVRFDRGAALLPDLGSGRLRLNALADFTLPGGQIGLAAHYRGTRGCKVTLFLLPGMDGAQAPLALDGEPRRLDAKGVESFGWRHGSVGYLLMAQGMSEARLVLIAEKLAEASLRLQHLNEAARQQLAESRARSAPCQA